MINRMINITKKGNETNIRNTYGLSIYILNTDKQKTMKEVFIFEYLFKNINAMKLFTILYKLFLIRCVKKNNLRLFQICK